MVGRFWHGGRVGRSKGSGRPRPRQTRRDHGKAAGLGSLLPHAAAASRLAAAASRRQPAGGAPRCCRRHRRRSLCHQGPPFFLARARLAARQPAAASWSLCLSAVSSHSDGRRLCALRIRQGPAGRPDRHACWQCGLVSSHASFDPRIVVVLVGCSAGPRDSTQPPNGTPRERPLTLHGMVLDGRGRRGVTDLQASHGYPRAPLRSTATTVAVRRCSAVWQIRAQCATPSIASVSASRAPPTRRRECALWACIRRRGTAGAVRARRRGLATVGVAVTAGDGAQRGGVGGVCCPALCSPRRPRRVPAAACAVATRVCGGGVGIGCCCVSPARAGEAARSTVRAPRGARASLRSRRPSGPPRPAAVCHRHPRISRGSARYESVDRGGRLGRGPHTVRCSWWRTAAVLATGARFPVFFFSMSAPFPPPRAPPFDLVRPRECRHPTTRLPWR